MLLVLASAVILMSGSLGTHDHILLSQIRKSPNLEGQVPVYMSPGNTLARVLFSSPPTSRRAVVEVFDPAFHLRVSLPFEFQTKILYALI
jgi:hypothetical protein